MGNLAGFGLAEDTGFLFGPVRREQTRDRLADDLLGRVAEHFLRAVIPTDYAALQVLAHDGIVGGLDDRSHKRPNFLSLLAFGDIGTDAGHSQRSILLIIKG